jgi:hypothetical protein
MSRESRPVELVAHEHQEQLAGQSGFFCRKIKTPHVKRNHRHMNLACMMANWHSLGD